MSTIALPDGYAWRDIPDLKTTEGAPVPYAQISKLRAHYHTTLQDVFTTILPAYFSPVFDSATQNILTEAFFEETGVSFDQDFHFEVLRTRDFDALRRVGNIELRAGYSKSPFHLLFLLDLHTIQIETKVGEENIKAEVVAKVEYGYDLHRLMEWKQNKVLN